MENRKMNISQIVAHMQTQIKTPKDASEAEKVLEGIAEVILKQIEITENHSSINQVVLNVAFRSYYRVQRAYDLKDKYFFMLAGENLSYYDATFQMLFAILQSDHWENTDSVAVRDHCIHTLRKALQSNSSSILIILKTLNLVCKRYPTLPIDVSLHQIYDCLQCYQNGMREETLLLLQHCCRQSTRAFDIFQIVLTFWPWTNRNKFYCLSSILHKHKLSDFLSNSEQSPQEFFAGVRLSLQYKNLLAASQWLVKIFSNQNSAEFLDLCADILTRGTRMELHNFHSQWFARIAQKDELFELLQQKPEIARFLGESSSCNDSTENYRLVLIFSIFSHQIYAVSKLHFFKISTELITNCFQFKIDAQLLIYMFIVDNLCSFALEDCLEFILTFIKQHKCIENAQFRNSVLGKLPTIINYISKSFSKVQPIDSGSTLSESINIFFQQLQQLIETDIASKVYQPKIFSLKILEILLKSLYAQNIKKNAKNCNVSQNQQLGNFLIQHNVFNATKVSASLLSLLHDPVGYDDVLLLITSLLSLLHQNNLDESFHLCKDACVNSDIDECLLSCLYAKVVAQTITNDTTNEMSTKVIDLIRFCCGSLQPVEHLTAFRNDPLLMCKTKGHVFGYLNTINEVIFVHPHLLPVSFRDLLNLLDKIVNTVIDMLSLANVKNNTNHNTASFQDMDESLDMLVQSSAVDIANIDSQECRKYLLLSFWLTLKACCDLATTAGCILVPTSGNCIADLDVLKQCLDINVAVLTRCRHKGAIEAAGVSIGKLTKCITTRVYTDSAAYQLLHKCLELLFDDGKLISTTRRGAGFSIMLLHIAKNEEQCSRPLLKRALDNILSRLSSSREATEIEATTSQSWNYDRMETLTLHYLCVLVKDTELREAMNGYYDDILMAATQQIDNPDWTVCNAALQLFGALIPKIVGQRQASEFDEPIMWESSEITFSDILRKLPKTSEYILEYCNKQKQRSTCTRSIILFLGFLSKVEHLRRWEYEDEMEGVDFLRRLRELTWNLLQHNCEAVRKLAAMSLVRTHEIRCELPNLLLRVTDIIFKVKSENFFQGLIYVMTEGVLKIEHESKHTVPLVEMERFMRELKAKLETNFNLKSLRFYNLAKLLDMLVLLGVERESHIFLELVKVKPTSLDCIGYDVWSMSVAKIAN